MRKVFLVCITLFALFSLGCAKKQTISKEEAQRVLNDFFAKNCILLPMDESETFKLDTHNAPLHVKRGVKKYEFFEKLGYYELHKNKAVKTYKLTQTGQKHFVYKKQRLFIEKGFCAGQYEAIGVEKIDKTEEIFSRKALKIRFKAKVSKRCDFAKTTHFLEAFDDFDSFANTPKKAILIFTENGWSVKKE